MQTIKANEPIEKISLPSVSSEGFGYIFAIIVNMALSIMFAVIG